MDALKVFGVICLLAVFSLCVAEQSGPIVRTECGDVNGMKDPSSGVYQFLGIPYATPPVGKFRWKATQPLQQRYFLLIFLSLLIARPNPRED